MKNLSHFTLALAVLLFSASNAIQATETDDHWMVEAGLAHSATVFDVRRGGTLGTGPRRGASDLAAIDKGAGTVALSYGREYSSIRWEVAIAHADNTGEAHYRFSGDIPELEHDSGTVNFSQNGLNALSGRVGIQLEDAWIYLGLVRQEQDLRYHLRAQDGTSVHSESWTARNTHALAGGLFDLSENLQLRLEHSLGNADGHETFFDAHRITFREGSGHMTRLTLGWRF